MKNTLLDAVQDQDFAVRDLSPALRDLVWVVGLPAALKLSARYGGTDLVVPSDYAVVSQKRLELCGVIGDEATKKLIQHHSGEKLYIPKGERALRLARNRVIEREYDAGETTAARLAIKHNLSERQVRTILNKIPQPTRQLTLDFGPPTS